MSILIKHRSRNATNLFYDTLKIVLLLLVLLLFNKPFLYAQSNYQYDSDGRLTADLSEGIVKIEWNRSNKVTHIQRADTSHMPDLEFIYDAHNNRVAKLAMVAVCFLNRTGRIHIIFTTDEITPLQPTHACILPLIIVLTMSSSK